jgi:secondary thiamine-phosphate synthase enzyme
MPLKKLLVNTSGEEFNDITRQVKDAIDTLAVDRDGIAHLFCMHTSCGLTISESYDPSAKKDLELFMQHLAPRNLGFITHDCEGPDDSPSHMKSILLNQNIAIPVEAGKLLLGQWQGIYLAEFRDDPKTRTVIVKFVEG